MEYIVELEGIHTVNDGDPILNSLSVCFLFFFIHLSLQNVIEYKIVKKKKSSKFFVSALKSSVTLTRRGHICIKFRLFIEQRDTLKSGKVFSITFESTYTNVRKNKLFCLTRINKNTFTKYESSFSFFFVLENIISIVYGPPNSGNRNTIIIQNNLQTHKIISKTLKYVYFVTLT